MEKRRKAEVDISIIVPVFNHAKYISKAFDSILNQKTRFTYEIVVGDDCSTDYSNEIIQEYAERYPDIFVNISRNRNVGATTNIYELLQRAKGSYIAFCEGDDYWCDDTRIEQDVGWLIKNPEYAGICGRTIPVDEDGERLALEKIPAKETFWIYEKDCFTINEFSEWKMPGHLSALTLRNFLRDGNADGGVIREAHPVVADRTLVLMGLLRGRIKCRPQNISCYRFRITGDGTNYMSAFKKKNLRYEDYHMMCILETYAQETFGQLLDLSSIKEDRFIGSVLVWLDDRNHHNWNVVKKIASESGHKMRCFYYIGNIVIKKTIMRISGNERRIESGGYRL